MHLPTAPAADSMLLDPALTVPAGPTVPAPMSPHLARTALARTRLARADGFVIDLDGTLTMSGQALPGARALLAYGAERYAIVSNNSSDTSTGLARKLARLGLAVAPQRIVLAGEQTVLLIAQHYAQARIRLVASATLTRFALSHGCRLVEHNPDWIVLARDMHFSYAKLTSIANQLRAGARLIVTNPDLSHPALGGGLMPETGSLMNAVVACSGVTPARIVGKPEEALFTEALRRLGTPAPATLVIGDTPETDALGAARLGMPVLLVGAHAQADVASLGELFEAG